MKYNDYEFTTHWRVEGTKAEVFDILEEPTALTEWWSAVYLDVTNLTDNATENSVFKVHAKGWLPYTLTWYLYPGERDGNDFLSLKACGDLEGEGEWYLRQKGDHVHIKYLWNVTANKPLLRWLSPLVRPVFKLNHKWAMHTGEKSLQREIVARRTADNREEAVPDSPQPPTNNQRPVVAIVALLIALILYFGYRSSRSE